jgi:hypothetical protein
VADELQIRDGDREGHHAAPSYFMVPREPGTLQLARPVRATL